MERICQVLLALALVAPALTAPGPVPGDIYQQVMGGGADKSSKSSKVSKPPKTSKDTHAASIDPLPVPWPAPTVDPPTPASEAGMNSSPVELFKRKNKDEKNDPTVVLCTPGDRFCHASLSEILVCNDYQQWVTYSECGQGTFCHRLHMVCVPEVTNSSEAISQPMYWPDDDNATNTCKPGDRRCSDSFNRVDRCNEQNDWVTYHDCRKAEYCDATLLECLPYGSEIDAIAGLM
ncbi:hypothetical protein F4861DRAFT_508869 [Xylaria intraflava]|nr:hypothetical protein F4861DRAFT_508869 [Xylaria intraflava]